MPAKRKQVREGVYRDQRGTFWIRVWIDGRRKWKKLDATNLKYAVLEAHGKKSDQARAKMGYCKDPFADGGTFGRLAELYLAAGCPDKKLKPRPEAFCAVEKYRLDTIIRFWGAKDPSTIDLSSITEYATWRRGQCKRGNGERTIDLDLVTASNVLNYAVMIKLLKVNGIRNGRPRFREGRDVVHSRRRAPANGDQVHQMADYFFNTLESEVMGWLALFSMLSGCRNVELRMLRADAKSYDEPGFIEENCLYIRRAKGGKSPYVRIDDDFSEMLDCWRNWKQTRYPDSPWFFPGWVKGEPVQKDSLRNAMYRASAELELPNITPHGLRSYYVTKRRSDGASDATIADEIGDSTAALIPQVYGERPPNWKPNNTQKLSFRPSEGLPAWERWRPIEEKIVSIAEK